MSDIVIIYPLLLLHKQFPDAPDLEDTELGIWKQFSKQNGEFFQILDDKNYWLVVARVVECAEVEVYLYDSLPSGYTSKNVVKKICQINFFQGKQLRFCKRSVQQQSKGVDCGAFAVALTMDLLFGFTPKKRNYDESKLRSDLLMCLEKGRLVPFPQSTETRKKPKQSLTLIDVYCKCRAAFFESDTDENPGLHMIECTVCKEWFHKKRERVPNIYFRDHKKVWKCFFWEYVYSYIDSFNDYF